MKYHAHIYWRDDRERDIALGMRLDLHDRQCGLGRIKDAAIGPHPLPMYQVMYDADVAPSVEAYLRDHADTLSILLHEDVGEDHRRDHTEGARWIGEELTLRLDVFG